MTGTASAPRRTPSQLPVPLVVASPRSAASGWVGIAGVASALVSIALLQPWFEPAWMKAVAVMATAALAMVCADIAAHRIRSLPWGLGSQPARRLDLVRVGQKLVGFWVTVGALAAAYWLLPVYADASLAPFKEAALASLPALIVIAPFYIAFVDRRLADPDDAYLQLSGLLAGVRPADWTILRQHALGWIVPRRIDRIQFRLAAE